MSVLPSADPANKLFPKAFYAWVCAHSLACSLLFAILHTHILLLFLHYLLGSVARLITVYTIMDFQLVY